MLIKNKANVSQFGVRGRIRVIYVEFAFAAGIQSFNKKFNERRLSLKE